MIDGGLRALELATDSGILVTAGAKGASTSLVILARDEGLMSSLASSFTGDARPGLG